MTRKITWLITILLISCVNVVYASHSDTITYERRRASKIGDAMLDIKSGAIRTITSDHSRIHNYEAYSYNMIDTLADGEKSVIAIIVPDSVEFHLKAVNVWHETSPALICIYAHPDTIRMSTDTITPNNRNQDDNANNEISFSATTITDSVDTMGLSLCLDPAYFGGGSGIGGASFAGDSPSELEWIFSDTQLIVVLENLSGDPAKTTMCIFWYERPESD